MEERLTRKQGIVVQPSPGAVPRLKRYLDEQEGKPLDNVWSDIPPINSQAQERLGYPTQETAGSAGSRYQSQQQVRKTWSSTPLRRSCGLTPLIDAAEKHRRRWVGIDITQLATSLIGSRLQDTYRKQN